MKKQSAHKRHEAMVTDAHRTPLLLKAIQKKVRKGDIVFDLGCGLGILTEAALKTGASAVYGCDIDPEAIKIAQKKLAQKKMANRALLLNDLSSDINIPEKVDVILAETVGSLGLDENILPFVIDARRRFLKKGGKIIPEQISVFAAPVEIPIDGGCRGVLHTPQDVAPTKSFQTRSIQSKNLLAPGKILGTFNLMTTRYVGMDKELIFKTTRAGRLTGFAVWMETVWAKGLVTRTSPDDPPTHWKQAYLPIEPIKMCAGEKILFRLRILPDENFFATQSVIEWGCQKK